MNQLKNILLACLLLPGWTIAEEQSEFSLDYWSSTGQTKWRHDASYLNPLLGVPSSELDYQSIDSDVVEFNMNKVLPAGHHMALSIGTGLINSGLLVDDDYLSAAGAVTYGSTVSGNHRFSRTHSDISDSSLFYFSGKLSPQGYGNAEDWYDMKFNLSFHYWNEEYNAQGVRQIECTTSSLCDPPGTSGYAGVTVITNVVQWMGIGAGLDLNLLLVGNWSFYLDATFYPFMTLNNEDTHHLRSDLAQDPSISMSGTGTGLDLMSGFKLVFSETASLHIGYRLWKRHVKNQTITFHDASGFSTSANLLDFKTQRDGYIAGLLIKF